MLYVAFALFSLVSLLSAASDNAQSVPVSFSGTGKQVSPFFTLKPGLTIFKMTHDGERNFIVHLLDLKGNVVEYIVNEIGKFDGSKAMGIQDGGTYILDIDADDDWKIDISQAQPQTAQNAPVSFSGMGKQVSPFFTLKPGLTIFKMTHDGERNFIVHLLDLKGNVVGYLVNEIGKFNGSKATGIQDGGTYILDIDADGDWKIDIGQ